MERRSREESLRLLLEAAQSARQEEAERQEALWCWDRKYYDGKQEEAILRSSDVEWLLRICQIKEEEEGQGGQRVSAAVLCREMEKAAGAIGNEGRQKRIERFIEKIRVSMQSGTGETEKTRETENTEETPWDKKGKSAAFLFSYLEAAKYQARKREERYGGV